MSCSVPALQVFAPAVHVQMPYEPARAACLGPDQAQCKVCDIAGRVQNLTFLKAHTHLSPTVASPHELSRHAVHVQSPPEGELEELPSPVSSLSSRVLDAQGVYLMENGVTSILHFGPEVPSVMVEALLGECWPLSVIVVCTGPGPSHLTLKSVASKARDLDQPQSSPRGCEPALQQICPSAWDRNAA